MEKNQTKSLTSNFTHRLNKTVCEHPFRSFLPMIWTIIPLTPSPSQKKKQAEKQLTVFFINMYDKVLQYIFLTRTMFDGHITRMNE